MRFRVVGKCSSSEKWYFERLLKLRKELGLEKFFVFEGYVPDVAKFLSATDLVVHAAEAESFGMAVIEAMACGRPTAVRRGGGLAEILETEPGKAQGGLVLDTDIPQQWAAALDKVLRSPALMAKFRKETRKIALRFSLEPWVDRHLQWYRQLLEGEKTETSKIRRAVPPLEGFDAISSNPIYLDGRRRGFRRPARIQGH